MIIFVILTIVIDVLICLTRVPDRSPFSFHQYFQNKYKKILKKFAGLKFYITLVLSKIFKTSNYESYY